MSPFLAHAHNSRIQFKLDEIENGLQGLSDEVFQMSIAMAEAEGLIIEAREKVALVAKRRQEIAADVAILREMLGVR